MRFSRCVSLLLATGVLDFYIIGGGGGVSTVRSDRRDRPDRVEHVPIPPAAPTTRLDPFGSRRAPAAEELPLASAAE